MGLQSDVHATCIVSSYGQEMINSQETELVVLFAATASTARVDVPAGIYPILDGST